MKRSLLLQPLSREHHAALKLALACVRAAQSDRAEMIGLACNHALTAFAEALEPHFQTEEDVLLPKLRAASQQLLVQRTLADHHALRALRAGLQRQEAAALAEFGHLLTAHVRFEERELFPAVERTEA
jgi:iron-sulfur cluster repair protein YtfE (RIC family)